MLVHYIQIHCTKLSKMEFRILFTTEKKVIPQSEMPSCILSGVSNTYPSSFRHVPFRYVSLFSSLLTNKPYLLASWRKIGLDQDDMALGKAHAQYLPKLSTMPTCTFLGFVFKVISISSRNLKYLVQTTLDCCFLLPGYGLSYFLVFSHCKLVESKFS